MCIDIDMFVYVYDHILNTRKTSEISKSSIFEIKKCQETEMSQYLLLIIYFASISEKNNFIIRTRSSFICVDSMTVS